jgi:hypothetical protein
VAVDPVGSFIIHSKHLGVSGCPEERRESVVLGDMGTDVLSRSFGGLSFIGQENMEEEIIKAV